MEEGELLYTTLTNLSTPSNISSSSPDMKSPLLESVLASIRVFELAQINILTTLKLKLEDSFH